MDRDRHGQARADEKLPSIDRLTGLGDALLEDLASRLQIAGYAQEVVFEAERVAPAQLDSVRLPLVQWWLARQPGPARVLARLFTYSAAVPEGDVRAALGSSLADALLEAGVLMFVDDRSIRAQFRLTPLEGLWVFSDPPEAGGDSVMGPGITTLNLVRLMPTAPGATLDLGSGAGMLALLAAARGSPLAIGVDINPRAVALSQLNARLNQSRAQFRCGDMVAPVQGERFDLVFSQPPYVVKPSGVAATTYLHGGSWGDELAMRFVGAVAVVMAPRGRAFFLFDSAVGSREPLPDRLRAALKDAPVDLHVFAASGPSPDFQAVAYASLEAHDLGEVYRTSVWRYRQHLEETGAKSFIRALVVLTDSGVPNGRYTFQLPVPGFSGLDVSSLEEFLSGMELARASREELLAAKVCVSPRARFVEERPATDPQGEPKRSICFDKGALGTDREISEAGLVMFAALQAAPSVAVAAETFGAACGEKPEAVKEQVVSFVREGLLRGLLIAPSTLPPSS